MQSTIHCKVSLDDQYRRFLFSYVPSTALAEGVPKSTFGKLRTLISNLYGLVDEFTLKYKDDEGDLIIIGCDEEFNCAVGQSAGVLRLYIQLKNDPMLDIPSSASTSTSTTSTSTSTSTSTNADPSSDTSRCPFLAAGGHTGRGRHGHGRGGRGFGRGGHGHGHGHGHWHGHGHGHGHHAKHHRGGSKNKMEKLLSKREYISATLNDPSVPLEEWRRHQFQKKLECLDRRLALLRDKPPADVSSLSNAAPADLPTDGHASTSSSSTSDDDKWRKKKCDKHRQKHAHGHHKQRLQRRIMTEDEKAAFRELKNQIWELRPLVNTIKIQMCEKKAAKAEANDRGDVERVRELEREMEQLKEIKREHKKAIRPLKEQIFALKFEQR